MDKKQLTLLPLVLCHCGVLTLQERDWLTIREEVHAGHIRLCQHSWIAIISMESCLESYEAYLHRNLDKSCLNPSEQVGYD